MHTMLGALSGIRAYASSITLYELQSWALKSKDPKQLNVDDVSFSPNENLCGKRNC